MAERNEPGCSHQSASEGLASDTLTSFTTVSSDREDSGEMPFQAVPAQGTK